MLSATLLTFLIAGDVARAKGMFISRLYAFKYEKQINICFASYGHAFVRYIIVLYDRNYGYCFVNIVVKQ